MQTHTFTYETDHFCYICPDDCAFDDTDVIDDTCPECDSSLYTDCECMDDMRNEIDIAFDRWVENTFSPLNTYIIEGRNMGWRHQNGSCYLELRYSDAHVIDLIGVNSDYTQKWSIPTAHEPITIVQSHHNAPTGETYTIKPLSPYQLCEYLMEEYLRDEDTLPEEFASALDNMTLAYMQTFSFVPFDLSRITTDCDDVSDWKPWRNHVFTPDFPQFQCTDAQYQDAHDRCVDILTRLNKEIEHLRNFSNVVTGDRPESISYTPEEHVVYNCATDDMSIGFAPSPTDAYKVSLGRYENTPVIEECTNMLTWFLFNTPTCGGWFTIVTEHFGVDSTNQAIEINIHGPLNELMDTILRKLKLYQRDTTIWTCVDNTLRVETKLYNKSVTIIPMGPRGVFYQLSNDKTIPNALMRAYKEAVREYVNHPNNTEPLYEIPRIDLSQKPLMTTFHENGRVTAQSTELPILSWEADTEEEATETLRHIMFQFNAVAYSVTD